MNPDILYLIKILIIIALIIVILNLDIINDLFTKYYKFISSIYNNMENDWLKYSFGLILFLPIDIAQLIPHEGWRAGLTFLAMFISIIGLAVISGMLLYLFLGIAIIAIILLLIGAFSSK